MKRAGATLTDESTEEKSGTIRVSNSAKVRLREVVEEIALQIAHFAVRYTYDSGKKTVTADEIKRATENFLRIGRAEEEEK